MQAVIHSPLEAQLLASHQFQGNRNDCGAFTLAIVINALKGTQLRGEDLSTELNQPAWWGPLPIIRRIPNWAIFPWGMVDVFKSYKLPAHWRLFGRRDDLLTGLAEGKILMPITGSWSPLWAHVMTLVAWDPGQGWGFVNTQTAEIRIDWLLDHQFLQQWRNMVQIVVEIDHA